MIKQDSLSIDITPDSGKRIDKLTFPDLSIGNYQLLVKVIDRQGNLLGENIAKLDII